MKTLGAVVVLAAVSSLLGCKEQGPAGPAAAPPAAVTQAAAAAPAVVDATAAAKEVFATRCTPCHGPTGAGDGPASAGLTPKPANFNSAEWQASVKDDHIEKIILYGGAAVGKSPAMPPNPDFGSKPELVSALRAHLRSLKK